MMYKLIAIAPGKYEIGRSKKECFVRHLPTGSMTESSLGLISPSMAFEPEKINHISRFAYDKRILISTRLIFLLKSYQ